MDQETARKLFEVGATVLMLDVPVNTEVGIDVNSWNTGPEFKGIKMIPPGVHYVYWSAVSSEGSVGPRTGFFHEFQRAELLALRYRPRTEDMEPIGDGTEELERLRSNLKDLDRHLGPFPYDSWRKWVSLTNKISSGTIQRLQPASGVIHSVTQLVPETYCTKSSRTPGNPRTCPLTEDSSTAAVSATTTSTPEDAANLRHQRLTVEEKENRMLPRMECDPDMKIRYTPIPAQYPKDSSPKEVTKHSMDSSHQLGQYLLSFKKLYGDAVSSCMSDRNQVSEVLGELQFSFVCFLVGQSYDSFEHWKKLLKMFCSCDEALGANQDLYSTFVDDLYFQVREVPDDFFVDILSGNNFLVTLLTTFFQLARDNEAVGRGLKAKVERFKSSLTIKFQWEFSHDPDDIDEEDRPVVVDLDGLASQ